MDTNTTTSSNPTPASNPGSHGAATRFGGRGGFGGQGGNRSGGGKGGFRGKGGPRGERPKPEFDSKAVDIRRVTRMMAGGRRFNFAVTLVAGDRKGRVGVGTGKGGDTTLAINKAMNNAKKNMITLNLTKDFSLPHEVEAKYGSTVINLRPAPGRGLVAGSAVRVVLDLAGVKNTGSKILSRSKNKLNIARATIIALKKLNRK
jgi:small subunit ribosomal protein S5